MFHARPSLLTFAAALAAFFLAAPSLAADANSAAPRPNIVYLLADDLGWSDIGYHGSEIQTPHLDALAAGGVKLESYYVQPVCTPTRAAFMTGRYPMRLGLQVGVVRPWADYGLSLEERTLANLLADAGYTTAIAGKWHLGHFDRKYLPTQRGFHHQYGHYNGALDYFTHERDGGFDWHRNDAVSRDEGYTTELIGRKAERLIAEHDTKTPLFLYVPFNAPHSPLQALERHLALYPNIEDQRRRTYAAMVAALDEQVGKIVAAIKKRGWTENTLFLFSSDNGGPTNLGATNGKLRAGKATLYEGGVRVPAFATWKGNLKPGVVNEPLHIIDWYPTLARLAGGTLEGSQPLDGKDIWPTIAEGKPSPHEEILHNVSPTGGAIRVGNWKLIEGGVLSAVNETLLGTGRASAGKAKAGKDNGEAELVELFDLSKDPYEKENLAEQEPEKLAELRKRLKAYADAAVPPLSKPRSAEYKVPKVWGELE